MAEEVACGKPLCPWCRKRPVLGILEYIGPSCDACSWLRYEDRVAKCYYCGDELRQWALDMWGKIDYTILFSFAGEATARWVGYHKRCASVESPCHPSCDGCYVCMPYAEQYPEEFC
jgi:hypothetical protein